MIGILLVITEFVLVCALLGLVLRYLNEEDIDLPQLAAVLSAVYVVHRMRNERKNQQR